ncbi:T9SS type A sorting domain-containing protein [Tenacibaculum agarivorans]|uniref:T9SS type A sorting domain-containing protein n=1 Tax=Tenacibaculum agarivorans TaxID=1908389 RepID=UPI00094B8D26|nr:T9SS type A sorting domain-containing protein [Tenacibaculum agarivorans]
MIFFKKLLFALTVVVSVSTVSSQSSSTLNLDRRYDEVSWLINHNAYQNPEINASDNGLTGGLNQAHSVNTQLNNGGRSFMIDLQYGRTTNFFKGRFLRLGHGPAGFAYWMEMCDFLSKINNFLNNNKNEIITLHMQIDNGVTVNHIKDAFAGKGNRCSSSANVMKYVYAHPNNLQVWPTLKKLINDNKRLIVLSEKDFGSSAPSWLHYEFKFTRQNDFAANQVSELSQKHRFEIAGNPGRGNNKTSLLTINNFAVDAPLGVGDKSKAKDANEYNRMYNKLIRSWFSFGKRPSMAVDFYEQGNYSARNVMNEANRINEVRGRFKKADGSNFEDYVVVNSSLESNWYIHGAKARARLYYSFPARPGEPRRIKFSHPNYNFTPQEINLTNYDGKNKRTFRVDVTVTPKNARRNIVSTVELKQNLDQKIDIQVYDFNGRLLLELKNTKSLEENFSRINDLKTGVYIVRGFVDGKAYTKKIAIK